MLDCIHFSLFVYHIGKCFRQCLMLWFYPLPKVPGILNYNVQKPLHTVWCIENVYFVHSTAEHGKLCEAINIEQGKYNEYILLFFYMCIATKIQ